MTQEIHTIFGAGQIGTQLANHLLHQGKEVRLIRRSNADRSLPGVTWMQGDASDLTFAERASRDATTVYNTANPKDYHRWDGILQPLFRSIRNAASRSGALLVQLDNLYRYGKPGSTPFTENTVSNPCTAMGQLRAEQHQELIDARDSGDLRVAVGIASDFFGPASPNNAVFRPQTLRALARGKSVSLFGDPDQPHSYSYTPDVARALAILGTDSAAEGGVWHLPVAAQLTTRELLQLFAQHLNQPLKVKRAPAWLLAILAKVAPVLGAVAEMNYQWDSPYLVDDSAFRSTFGVEPTDLERAIVETMAAAIGRSTKTTVALSEEPVQPVTQPR